jgi:hypothetical protein
MKHFAIVILLTLAAVSEGCAMCQSPWDYCNAVIGPHGCPYCDYGARAGSAFHPMGGTPPTTEIGPRQAKPSKPSAEEVESPAPAEAEGAQDADAPAASPF